MHFLQIALKYFGVKIGMETTCFGNGGRFFFSILHPFQRCFCTEKQSKLLALYSCVKYQYLNFFKVEIMGSRLSYTYITCMCACVHACVLISTV